MIQFYHKSLTEPLKDPITGQPMTNKYHPATFAYDVGDITTLPTPINDSTLGRPADNADIDNYQQLLKDGVDKFTFEIEKGRQIKKELIELKDILNLGNHGVDSDGNPIRTPLSSTDASTSTSKSTRKHNYKYKLK